MTAPFAPPPSPLQIAVIPGLLLFGLAAPFARRDDWVGLAAFGIVAVVCAGLWTLLVWNAVRSIIDWWRDTPSTT